MADQPIDGIRHEPHYFFQRSLQADQYVAAGVVDNYSIYNAQFQKIRLTVCNCIGGGSYPSIGRHVLPEIQLLRCKHLAYPKIQSGI